MPSLAETQAAFRAVIAGGPDAALRSMLRSGEEGVRLEIYRRHHRESLRRHLRGRFPTVEWLLGTDMLLALADSTIALSPPRAPSLAEYGPEFIDTLLQAGGSLPPYCVDAARLDWSLGCLSVAVAARPLSLQSLAAIDPQRLADMVLELQPGLAFLRSDWPVDALIHIRQQASPPDRLGFDRQESRLQLQGARGRFSVLRLEPGAFAFRASLAGGQTLAAAAEAGVAAQSSFDLAGALGALFAEGLVTNHSGELSHD